MPFKRKFTVFIFVAVMILSVLACVISVTEAELRQTISNSYVEIAVETDGNFNINLTVNSTNTDSNSAIRPITVQGITPTPATTPTPSPSPTPSTPSKGLVAYYPFDGDTRDHSGNENDGTNYGATFVSGISGQALSFDGVNNYVSVPVNINPDVMPQMTMAAWARPDDDSGMTLISHDNGGFDRTIDIDYRGGGAGWSAFSGSGAVLGYHPVTIGEWVFIAAVYDQDAGTVKLYVNDAMYEEKGSLGSGWDYVNIGSNPSFGAYFSGTIDEVKIYNYALSADEITSLYEEYIAPPAPTPTPSPSPTPSKGLVAYHPFDGDTRDHSGNENDGTNYGATFVSGISGQALSFDGAKNYVSVPVNINPDVMPQMTMAAWARADDDSGMTLISHDNGGFDRTIDIDYRGGGNGWSAFSGSGAVLGYHPVTIGEWVFIAAVYDQDAGTVKLYVNDAMYEEKGSLGSGWDYVNIGSNPSFGAYFSGTIDEVKIYNYALSADEITSLYEEYTAPPAPTPTPSPSPTPTHPPTPLIVTPREVGILSPEILVATLNPGESVTETKTYTTAEGKPITKVDVLFDFDLTGSMGEELSTMKTESQNIMNDLLELVPDSAFGVASFMDYPGSFSFGDYSDTYGASSDYPWKLNRGITTDTDAVHDVINGLELGNGQDYPEAYSRALYETYADPGVGWRTGAKKIVIMFGDDIPHDPAYTTGIDPGRDGEVGTADDLYFEEVVAGLKSHGITALALHSGSDDRPWRYMAEETGGIYHELTHAEASKIPEAIASMVEAEVEKIGELTLRAETGYEDWVSFTPTKYTDVGGGETGSFEVKVTVPKGAIDDTYEFEIALLGDGTVLGTQVVTVTVPKTATPTPGPSPSPEPDISAVSQLENCNISIKESGDTIISFSFRPSPQEEAGWLASRFEISKNMENALEERFTKDADVIKISSRESTVIIPILIEPKDKTYTMPELNLREIERGFQDVAISLVPTTVTIEFPDEYAETFVDTAVIPETSHAITGKIKPWIKISRPPSGAALRNATAIHVMSSDEVKRVSLLIQGVRWEKRFENVSSPFDFEWDTSDPDVAGGSYRIEATGFVEEDRGESIKDAIIVDVEKPDVPPATLIAVLVACITAGVAAAGAAASSLRATTSMHGRHGSGIADLKFSFHRSVLAEKYRTSKLGDFLRIVLGIGALSLAYTLQCTLPMKTVSFTSPFSMPSSEEGIRILVPTFESFDSNALGIFFLIIALVGTVILVREAVQHFLAWVLDAEVGALIDKTATIFVLGSGIFGHPFGYPLRSIIWEDLSPRVKGLICLGNIMSLFSLLAFFYYVSFVWFTEAWWIIWVEGVAIPAVAMSLVYSLLPFVGEEGTVIFEWNKLLAITLLVIAGFMYLSLILHLFDPLTLQFSFGMISLASSGVLIAGLLIYKFMGWINLI